MLPTTERPIDNGTSPASSSPISPDAAAAPEAAQRKLAVSHLTSQVGYSNFCCVTTGPEEVLLDFGLNAQYPGQEPGSVQITHRLALTRGTARRLLSALQMALERKA